MTKRKPSRSPSRSPEGKGVQQSVDADDPNSTTAGGLNVGATTTTGQGQASSFSPGSFRIKRRKLEHKLDHDRPPLKQKLTANATQTSEEPAAAALSGPPSSNAEEKMSPPDKKLHSASSLSNFNVLSTPPTSSEQASSFHLPESRHVAWNSSMASSQEKTNANDFLAGNSSHGDTGKFQPTTPSAGGGRKVGLGAATTGNASPSSEKSDRKLSTKKVDVLSPPRTPPRSQDHARMTPLSERKPPPKPSPVARKSSTVLSPSPTSSGAQRSPYQANTTDKNIASSRRSLPPMPPSGASMACPPKETNGAFVAHKSSLDALKKPPPKTSSRAPSSSDRGHSSNTVGRPPKPPLRASGSSNIDNVVDSASYGSPNHRSKSAEGARIDLFEHLSPIVCRREFSNRVISSESFPMILEVRLGGRQQTYRYALDMGSGKTL